MKQWFVRALLACLLGFGMVAHAEDDSLRAAIAGKHRSQANVARDPARHPYETLRFFGIESNTRVVELTPGGGWYTEILGPYLRSSGQLIAAGDDPAAADAGERRSGQRMAQRFAASPDVFGRVGVTVFKPGASTPFAPEGSIDMVLTFRNVHNWIAGFDEVALKKTFAGIYASLKPGGVFGVVEHRLPEDRAQDPRASTGYVHPSFIIKLAEEAGFRLAGQSEINANPKDTADHKRGVWALPPSYANGDTDRATYAAIGESDRMTLKFVKPN